ncbi:MAG: hypothetical protein R2769_11615 [Saprospiraceae bacterium]
MALNLYRRLSLRAWKMERILNDTTILEKMTLFWHNHFVTADINDPGFGPDTLPPYKKMH